MNKTVRRATLVLALTPMLSLPVTAAFAGVIAPTGPLPVAPSSTTTTTTTTPAPGATASASAVQVNGIITVGGTNTSANGSGASASADSLDILGMHVSGGSTNDPSKPAKGDLIGTGDTPVGDAEVAPYAATVTKSGGDSSADADAALFHSGLAGLLQVWVLHSHSHSDYTPGQSSGSSSSDGAEIQGPSGTDIKVLHAEASSGHEGKSDLLVVDGTEVGSSSQANGACKLNLDPVINLLCLSASGGTGSNGVTTSGATVVSATGIVPTTTVVGAGTSGGSSKTTVTPTTTKLVHNPAHRPATKPASGPLPHTGPGLALPHTGTEIGLLAAYGAALVALGAGVVTAGRRRRVHAFA
jgi:LPXTG-motif cell wall-anchored protein